jgi:hypothetical protein
LDGIEGRLRRPLAERGKTMKRQTQEGIKEALGIAALLGLAALAVKLWFVAEGFRLEW